MDEKDRNNLVGGGAVEGRQKWTAADGTEYSLEELIQEYGTDVLRTAYLYVKDREAAEDLFQEIFIRVAKNLNTFQGNSSIKTWIMRITINLCKDYLKSSYQRHVVPMMEFMEDSITSEDSFHEIEKAETAKTVKEAVFMLPEHYRAVILCVYYQDMTLKETAETLHIAEGTVKSRLKRARQRLKECLEGRI